MDHEVVGKQEKSLCSSCDLQHLASLLRVVDTCVKATISTRSQLPDWIRDTANDSVSSYFSNSTFPSTSSFASYSSCFLLLLILRFILLLLLILPLLLHLLILIFQLYLQPNIQGWKVHTSRRLHDFLSISCTGRKGN